MMPFKDKKTRKVAEALGVIPEMLRIISAIEQILSGEFNVLRTAKPDVSEEFIDCFRPGFAKSDWLFRNVGKADKVRASVHPIGKQDPDGVYLLVSLWKGDDEIIDKPRRFEFSKQDRLLRVERTIGKHK